ncbi:hypothetical protein PT218_27660, partial [Klebsiella pneumoniae]|uniref:hypothetical protein n=1 Tax=Klebsiella pneumoniae TaxID=573 RepID=UPI0023648816
RFECDGYEPTSFHELSRRVDCYKVHTSTAAPAGDEESEEWPSPVFPKFIAYSRHQSGVRSRYWPDYFHWRCWSLQL